MTFFSSCKFLFSFVLYFILWLTPWTVISSKRDWILARRLKCRSMRKGWVSMIKQFPSLLMKLRRLTLRWKHFSTWMGLKKDLRCWHFWTNWFFYYSISRLLTTSNLKIYLGRLKFISTDIPTMYKQMRVELVFWRFWTSPCEGKVLSNVVKKEFLGNFENILWTLQRIFPRRDAY